MHAAMRMVHHHPRIHLTSRRICRGVRGHWTPFVHRVVLPFLHHRPNHAL